MSDGYRPTNTLRWLILTNQPDKKYLQQLWTSIFEDEPPQWRQVINVIETDSE